MKRNESALPAQVQQQVPVTSVPQIDSIEQNLHLQQGSEQTSALPKIQEQKLQQISLNHQLKKTQKPFTEAHFEVSLSDESDKEDGELVFMKYKLEECEKHVILWC